MNSKRAFILMIVFGVLSAGLLVGSVVMGDQLLRKQSSKLTDLKLQNAVIESQQTALSKAKKDIVTYTQLNETAKQIVPQDKDQARAVREIISIAEQSGVSIASITFPSSNLGQSQPKAATGDGAKTDTATSATPEAPPLSQVKPVDGIKGVYQLEISVNTTLTKPVTYTQLLDFLNRLEQNRRTAQITNLSIQPNSLNRNVLTFSLQLTIYIKP